MEARSGKGYQETDPGHTVGAPTTRPTPGSGDLAEVAPDRHICREEYQVPPTVRVPLSATEGGHQLEGEAFTDALVEQKTQRIVAGVRDPRLVQALSTAVSTLVRDDARMTRSRYRALMERINQRRQHH